MKEIYKPVLGKWFWPFYGMIVLSAILALVFNSIIFTAIAGYGSIIGLIGGFLGLWGYKIMEEDNLN